MVQTVLLFMVDMQLQRTLYLFVQCQLALLLRREHESFLTNFNLSQVNIHQVVLGQVAAIISAHGRYLSICEQMINGGVENLVSTQIKAYRR